MSRYRSDPETLDAEKPSGCASFLHYSWKTVTCIFSHVTLISMVISYCYLGAVTFEALEVNHEIKVKKSIRKIRENTTWSLWNFTQEMAALQEEDFVPQAKHYLKDFENSLLKSMAKDGWDGEEDPTKVQWTMAGALFYSIVVITTIGYGHITPKTDWGKVVTIFYAILGIPLMLLCLSNIGDIMATSFRFLYWRVCCFVCQKKPKKRQRGRSFRVSTRNQSKFVRSRSATTFRRSMRTAERTLASQGHNYHSDTELRYPDEYNAGSRNSMNRRSRFDEANSKKQPNHVAEQRSNLSKDLLEDVPVLCNRYALQTTEARSKTLPARRATSMPKSSNLLQPPRAYSPDSSSDKEEVSDEPRRARRKIKPRRSRSPLPNSSPKMMTPLGYGQSNSYWEGPESDDGEEYESRYSGSSREKRKPVPIWLCVLLVISYILAGAFLFKSWEGWSYLDAAYFCFITLTTIGFGDLVPAKGVNQDRYYATVSIALCSLYLLFGISLLAMSFNLVQEEVISNVKSIAKTLGIIKSESDESEEEED